MEKKFNEYSIEVKIDVENQSIYSNAQLVFINKSQRDKLNFYLHKDMEVEDIRCPGLKNYNIGEKVENWCPFVFESKLVELCFQEPILEKEVVEINFKYKGKLDIVSKYKVNRLTDEWVELGLYTPWFPLYEKLEEALFHVKIEITEDYEVINGIKKDNHYILEQKIPVNDCTIIASNNLHCEQSTVEGIKVDVYYIQRENEEQSKEISKYSTEILNIFKAFGEIKSKRLSVFIAPRDNGGGYCRPGLIVLTPNDKKQDEIGYFKYIAHELAHLWWLKANVSTWEDWLNESFAEYSALLALREVFGEEAFSKLITQYQSKSKELPAIKGIERSDSKAWEVLYIKGPLVLYNLEKAMGREKFKKFLKNIHESKIDTTEKLLNYLQDFTNAKVKEQVLSALEE